MKSVAGAACASKEHGYKIVAGLGRESDGPWDHQVCFDFSDNGI